MTLSISVAMCTFNGEQFIYDQVQSILDQTLLPEEIIIADDGSTDQTLEVVRRLYSEYEGRKPKLRFLPIGERLGVARNFERAMLSATTDLVALSDQDDIWHKDRLLQAVEWFERDELLLLQHTNACLIDEVGASLGISLFQALSLRADERDAVNSSGAFATYLRRNLVTGATTMVRRELISAAAPFPTGWLHDEWLGIVAASTGHVQLLDAELVDYRQHGSNVVGVKAPTLSYRVRRMLEPRGNRYESLARRADSMVVALLSLGVTHSVELMAFEKADFESKRARYPRRRLARFPRVVLGLLKGSYRRYSSQGNLDALRDLLQPA